jgi:hypothetical protein
LLLAVVALLARPLEQQQLQQTGPPLHPQLQPKVEMVLQLHSARSQLMAVAVAVETQMLMVNVVGLEVEALHQVLAVVQIQLE